MRWKMKTCVFFGHAKENYKEYEVYIEEIIIDLIEKKGVTQFYSGGRGKFDRVCAEIVKKLKENYPEIRNTLVLSYIPQEKDKFIIPKPYDETVYLLEKRTPPKFAISKTNEVMVDKADFVVVATRRSWGGAQKAHEYAKRRKKEIINIFDYAKDEDELEREMHEFIERQNREEKKRVWEKLVIKMNQMKEK